MAKARGVNRRLLMIERAGQGWRIAKRRGQQRALIAIAHSLLTIFWWMLTEGVAYQELGPDYLAGRDQPDRRRRQLVDQLERLGYHVELTPAA